MYHQGVDDEGQNGRRDVGDQHPPGIEIDPVKIDLAHAGIGFVDGGAGVAGPEKGQDIGREAHGNDRQKQKFMGGKVGEHTQQGAPGVLGLLVGKGFCHVYTSCPI